MVDCAQAIVLQKGTAFKPRKSGHPPTLWPDFRRTDVAYNCYRQKRGGVPDEYLLQDYGKVQGTYREVGCKLVCMNNPTTGEPELMRSLSLVLELPQVTDRRLKLQNTVSVRQHLGSTQEKADVHRVDQHVDPGLLTPEEISDLNSLDAPFVLTLLEDQLTMTIYGMFQAEFYESVLELLNRVCGRLAEVGQQNAVV
jgi:hypothetical protein